MRWKSLTSAIGCHTSTKAKNPNKFENLYGYPKRYPECDIRNIDLRNPKHFVSVTYNPIARQVLISEKKVSEICFTLLFGFGLIGSVKEYWLYCITIIDLKSTISVAAFMYPVVDSCKDVRRQGVRSVIS